MRIFEFFLQSGGALPGVGASYTCMLPLRDSAHQDSCSAAITWCAHFLAREELTISLKRSNQQGLSEIFYVIVFKLDCLSEFQ